MAIDTLLTKYALNARSQGISPETIKHIKRCVGFFDSFMGGISDVRAIKPDDLRRFLVALQSKTKWADCPQANGKPLSTTSLNTYARAIKQF